MLRESGSVVADPITAQYLTVVSLPRKIRGTTGAAVAYWETEEGSRVGWEFTVPDHDVKLYPVLIRNLIANASELVEFAANVNQETDYTGITMYLEGDIVFTEELAQRFAVIGNGTKSNFRGTFDGQGHVISGLIVESGDVQVGLFGYSEGVTIRNVVVDETCTVALTRASSTAEVDVYVGGIIGYCASVKGPCTVESSVNMANVSFSGLPTGKHGPHVGGIAGYLRNSGAAVAVRNCANYGAITHGLASSVGYIGGVVGRCSGFSALNRAHVQNSLNSGSITYKNALYNSYIGGIVGEAEYATIENCAGAGEIVIGKQGESIYIGGVAGSSISGRAVHTLWTNTIEGGACGSGELETDGSTGYAELGLEAVVSLRDYTEGKLWNKWVLNANGAEVTFRVGEGEGFAVAAPLVLLPDLADSNEHVFGGWYMDAAFREAFTAAAVEGDTVLYGRLTTLVHTVTFDVNGGEELPWKVMTVKLREPYGTLPAANRSGYAFLGWYTADGEVVTSETIVTIQEDHTLTARWSANKYVVTLDVNGGDELAVKEITVTYDATYGTLPRPNRSGYAFKGWFSENGVPILRETIVKTPRDHTLHAEWAEILSEKVEIIFVRDDMNKKDVEDFVRRYTSASFKVVKVEEQVAEGTRAVVKFAELKGAVAFVETVRASSSAHGVVQKIGYALDESFSMIASPTFLILLFLGAILF